MADSFTGKTEEKGGEATAVLCVDADRNSNAVVGRLLAGDAELWEAGTFAAAIEAIKKRQFALVICDVTAADVRGMDVLSILADLYPSTPVFVTSAPGVAGWASEAFEALGAYAGMMKPYNRELLRVAINSALWATPVFGRGELGHAVLLQAAIHETAADELKELSEEERAEISTVAEVLEKMLPFMETGQNIIGDKSV